MYYGIQRINNTTDGYGRVRMHVFIQRVKLCSPSLGTRLMVGARRVWVRDTRNVVSGMLGVPLLTESSSISCLLSEMDASLRTQVRKYMTFKLDLVQ